MRTTSDLIGELGAEEKNAWLAAIVVGFPDETKFVFSTQQNQLDKLNSLIGKGGSPIGILRFVKEAEGIQGYYRPFDEYAGQDWVNGYLAGLLENTAGIIALSQEGISAPACGV